MSPVQALYGAARATDVRYEEAMDYARSIGKKLPTREQWMRAAFGDGNRVSLLRRDGPDAHPPGAVQAEDGLWGLNPDGSGLTHLVDEVIVVDGGSHDLTVDLSRPLADRVIQARMGRATQMRAGAAVADV